VNQTCVWYSGVCAAPPVVSTSPSLSFPPRAGDRTIGTESVSPAVRTTNGNVGYNRSMGSHENGTSNSSLSRAAYASSAIFPRVEGALVSLWITTTKRGWFGNSSALTAITESDDFKIRPACSGPLLSTWIGQIRADGASIARGGDLMLAHQER